MSTKPAKPVSTTKPPTTNEPKEESCSNCAAFLLTDQATGKGRCRLNPPVRVPNHEVTKSDADGRRWPIVWDSEWCKQWEEAE